jgi:hypothetical protein
MEDRATDRQAPVVGFVNAACVRGSGQGLDGLAQVKLEKRQRRESALMAGLYHRRERSLP